MDYRKENYCFDKRKYNNDRGLHPHSNDSRLHPHSSDRGFHSHSSDSGFHSHSNDSGFHPHSNDKGLHPHSNDRGFHPHSSDSGFHPQNTLTNPRYYLNERNPRDCHQVDKNPREYYRNTKNPRYQNVKTPRDYQNVEKPRYHKNDKDFRPQPYRTGFSFKDRDDRQLFSEIGDKESDRNRSTTVIKNKHWLNYVRNVWNWDSGKNEKKLLIDDEDFKKWNIGVEVNVTSDKPMKLHWQTKDQMDSYGMVGGHIYKEDCRTGEITNVKCSIYGQSGIPLQESRCRSRSMSMSRPREPLRNSRPEPRKQRSRSVCFSEKITHFEYENEYESDMNDFSQDNMEIDDDTSRNDVFEGESNDEQSSERKLTPENSMLKLALKDKINSVKSNKKFHGFGKDFSNDLRQLELRTCVIKMQNQYEEDCQEFAQNSYDVIMESTLADMNQTFYDYGQVVVHNSQTIFDGKLSDSFQDYLIPIEDILEDDTVYMVNTDNQFLRSQEEEFDAETNVALSNVFTNNFLSLPQEELSLSSYKPTQWNPPQESSFCIYNPTQTNPTLEVEADEQLDRPTSKSPRSNPRLMVEDLKICQNVRQLNPVHSVSEDPTDNETPKANEYPLDSHVENQSDIDNNCLQKLNLNYLAQKPTSLKMKIFKVKGNRFKVKHIEDYATEDTVHLQTASPLCAPAITTESSSLSTESSLFSVTKASNASFPLLQLRNCVFCSVCGAKIPRSLIDPGEMLEDGAWQCQDCAVCILCFRRDPGERFLVCCKCGHRCHKTCARVDQTAQHAALFVCKYCTAE